MADRPRSRQEIYDRIRATSKEEFILEDMIRLGFWNQGGRLPQDPADEIRRRGELERELVQLRKESTRLYNEEALIKELRARRFEEAKRKRKETKERNERLKRERAKEWQAKKARELRYLGEGVSGGLQERTTNGELLRKYGLPPLGNPEELAAAMGISVSSLRFLCFARKVAGINHYKRFRLSKKSGGERLISAPMPRLKAAQTWVLHNLLAPLAHPASERVDDAAHGFRKGRSIVSNALPHVGSEIVLNLDLKDFFPTVTYPRVRGLFKSLGFSEAVSTTLALLCTEPEVEEVELDGRRFFVALGPRRLPQGAPTSPALTNLLCRRLDRRLFGLARSKGFVYTRYADDLTFSAPQGSDEKGHVGSLLRTVESILVYEGFTINRDKTRILRRGQRREVTGIVVNERPTISREVLRRFRATLYQIEKDGPKDKRWGQGPDVLQSIWGFANYVKMVDPQKGSALVDQVRRILQTNGWQPPPGKRKAPDAPQTPPAEPVAQTQEAESPTTPPPKKKWWKLW